MRHSILVGVLALAAGCSFQPVDDGAGSTGGSGSSAGSASGGTTGTGRAGTSGGTLNAGTTGGLPGPGGTSGGGCGADDCPACPNPPYSCQDDHCVAGSWQCACGCLDGGSSRCGGAVCPAGCDLSADCSECIPESPTAGLGLACQSDLDCCTGTCVGGVCSEPGGPCGTQNPTCTVDSDCCTGFMCNDGLCTFGQGDGGGGLSCTPGTPPFVGAWSGTFSITESLSSGLGSGGGGADKETIVAGAATGELVFQGFLSSMFVGCSLDFQLQGSDSATVAPGATCTDEAGGTWTFSSGSVRLFGVPGPCAVAVSLFGTLTDPTESGSFSLGLTLTQ
jgi:hypothetical protein